MDILIKVKLLDKRAVIPTYAHSGDWADLAADLYSIESLRIAPSQIVRVSTGIAIALPPGFGAIVQDRSGLATKGITTLAGVIDPGYRGEIIVILANVSRDEITINEGDRIAQLRVVQRIAVAFQTVDELSSTARQESGFGSSGE